MSGSPQHRKRRVFLVLICAIVGTLLAVTLFLSDVYELSLVYPTPEPQIVRRLLLLTLLDIVGGIASLVLLWKFSGRYSLAAGLVIVGLSSVSIVAVPASAYAIVEVAAQKHAKSLACAFGVYVAAVFVGITLRPTTDEAVPLMAFVAVGALVFAVPVLIGFNVRSRREVNRLREREAENRVASAVLMERTRIAREIHDSVAHQLSLISLHSGVLETRSDLPPARVRKEAAIVGNAARAATDDVQSILTVLRNQSTTKMPPDMKDIPAMLSSLAQTGTPLRVSGLEELASVSLPTSHSQQVFRIVQEATTNAHKHGVPGSLEVSFAATDGLLNITTQNAVLPHSSAGGGAGLIGMRERVSLLGGSMTVTNTDDHFLLEVCLPCTQ